MRVNFDEVLKDHKGRDLDDNKEKLTLGSVVMTSLLMTVEADRNIPGKEKVRRFKLALRCDDGIQEISEGDAALIKARIAQTHPTLIVGRVWEALGENMDESDGS